MLLISETSDVRIEEIRKPPNGLKCSAHRQKGHGVGRYARLLERILSGRSDANIRFSDLVQFLLYLGFDERVRGDHHILTRTGVEEILNLQPRGAMAKPYQVKQVRSVILKYKLGADENE